MTPEQEHTPVTEFRLNPALHCVHTLELEHYWQFAPPQFTQTPNDPFDASPVAL